MVNLPVLLLYFLPWKIKYYRPYRIFADLLFIVLNTLALAANMLDVIYFRFTMKRSTGDLFAFVGTSWREVVSLIPDFIADFWWAFIIWIILIAILVFITKRKKILTNPSKLNPLKFYVLHSLLFVLIVAMSILSIRGGVQLKPISLIDAGRNVDVGQIPLVLNTPFAIITTLDKEGLKPVHYFENEDELNKIFNPVHLSKSNNPMQLHSCSDLNVVIIILESFSAEYIGALSRPNLGEDYEGYTPFLDSLIGQSLVYTGYANAQQSREGIPAVVASIPALMNKPYINSVYIGNEINSLPAELKKQNYHTAFFHGGLNGTMDFDAFAEIAGFEEYYGMNEYGNKAGFDGRWGIADEEFLQYTAGVLSGFNQPFMATIFTLSSHHPYIIPEKYKGKFKEGTLDIHRSIRYSDYALRQFFRNVSKTNWFENTLFVITADHTSLADDDYYKTSTGMFMIPIIYYQPGSDLKGKKEEITQQIDVMPSVLDYLGIESSYISFGSSIFDTINPGFAINYYNETYQLIKDGYVLKFNGLISIALFNQKADPLLERNLIKSKPEKTKELELFIKAFIQQFNSRMISNKMTFKKNG